MEMWWPGISVRLFRLITTSPKIFGYRWSIQCGHMVVILIRRDEVYQKERWHGILSERVSR